MGASPSAAEGIVIGAISRDYCARKIWWTARQAGIVFEFITRQGRSIGERAVLFSNQIGGSFWLLLRYTV